MVISPVVSEILGVGGTTPQMLLHCQKEQMLLTVKQRKYICEFFLTTMLIIRPLPIDSLTQPLTDCTFGVVQSLKMCLRYSILPLIPFHQIHLGFR